MTLLTESMYLKQGQGEANVTAKTMLNWIIVDMLLVEDSRKDQS